MNKQELIKLISRTTLSDYMVGDILTALFRAACPPDIPDSTECHRFTSCEDCWRRNMRRNKKAAGCAEPTAVKENTKC